MQRRQQESEERNQLTPRKQVFVLLILAAILFYFLASKYWFMQTLEYRTSDFFFSLRSQLRTPSPPDNIVIVAIDEPSMQELGLRWPWPRQVHADLVSTLHEAGAAVVVFDVVFAEPGDPQEDAYFARALKQAGNVILAEDRDVIKERMYQVTTPILPIPELKESAKDTGLIWMSLDPDGVLRRVNFLQADVPPLALVTAETYREKLGIKTDKSDPVTSFHIPQKLSKPVIVNYLGAPRTIRTVSYYQALNYKKWLNKDFFRDKIVMVGFDLVAPPDLKIADHFQYPLVNVSDAQIPGVEVHATLTDSLLRGRYITSVSEMQEWIMFLVLLALGVLILWNFSHWLGAVAYLVMMLAVFVGGFLLFYYFNLEINLVTPLSALLLMLISERIYGYAIVDREKRFIRKAFGHYISPVIVDQLIQNPDQLNLRGEYYDATVMFTDLVGFTNISEKLEPMKLNEILTDYFEAMMKPILEMNGTLDKFIGDAIMCFFGIPITTAEHANQALYSAWEMHLQLQRLNLQWAESDMPQLSMRIGINSGRVIAGNMGTEEVFNYTVMGDAVNLASRLESINTQYGTRIIFGENTHYLTQGNFDARMLDRIRVKGKDEPVSIYELLGPSGTVDATRKEQINLYEEAFNAYVKQDFDGAIVLLDKSLKISNDSPTLLLKERCETFLEEPPGEDWEGVYTFTTK